MITGSGSCRKLLRRKIYIDLIRSDGLLNQTVRHRQRAVGRACEGHFFPTLMLRAKGMQNYEILQYGACQIETRLIITLKSSFFLRLEASRH